jgi:hypothetical protein
LASGPEGSAYAPEGKMLFAFMSWPVKIDPKSLDPNIEVMRF